LRFFVFSIEILRFFEILIFFRMIQGLLEPFAEWVHKHTLKLCTVEQATKKGLL